MDHHHPPSPIITSTDQGNMRRRRSSSPSPPSPDSHGHDDSLIAPVLMGDATPAPSVAPHAHKPSLAAFLRRDIDGQEGHRLVLPFLTAKDRLCLSECCQGLLLYRFNLTKVKVIPHPFFSSSLSAAAADDHLRLTMRVALDNLLMGQELRGGGLQYLRVSHRLLIRVLDLVSRGCFRRLKTLDLGTARLWAEDVEYVLRALLGGGLASLEELDASGNGSVGGVGVRRIIGALRQGACPQLRRLNLRSTVTDEEGIGGAMAEAMESGNLHHLQELDLSFNAFGQGGMAAIARALTGGACPQLVRVGILGCRLRAEDGQALVMAMRAGGCAKLEALSLWGNRDIGNHVYEAIFASLEMGSCPNLKLLDLSGCFMTLDLPAVTALGRALLSGNCHHLQALALDNAFSSGEPDACLNVLHAIRQGGRGAMPNLLHLNLASISMAQEHGRMLGEAIGVGAFPKLEELVVSVKKNLGDCGVLAIMAGLEGGGCPHLKELLVTEVRMGPLAGQALGRALASGNLSCLQTLELSDNPGVGDEAMREVFLGLKGCHQLREMDVQETGMGREAGGALVQALQEGAWPQLREMNVMGNTEMFVDEEVGRGLVEVIEEGKMSCILELKLCESGLNNRLVTRMLGAIERGACPRLRTTKVDWLSLEEGWVDRLKGRGVRVITIDMEE